MAKREITARQAKQNLKPFGYDGPARWNPIDVFVEATPRASSALLANEGALVQSKALGFADGGVVEPSEEAVKKLADLQYLSYKTGVSTADMTKALNDVGIDPTYNIHSTSGMPDSYFTDRGIDTSTWEKIGTHSGTGKPILKNPNYDSNALNNILKKSGYTNSGNTSEFYGNNTATDPIADAFQSHEAEYGTPQINSSTANMVFAEKIMKEKGITADQTSYVTAAQKGMTEEDLQKAYQEGIGIAQNAWAKSGYTQADGQKDILDYAYKVDTTPDPTPLPTTIPIEPTQQEVEKAQQVFSPDGKVTLPTGYEQPVQKMVMTDFPFQPTSPVSGVTTAQAQTFGNNQGQQFAKRATDQAQLIQPQTLAEKQAAGQTGKIEQRLFKNPQGMSTYVTGTVGVDGNWNPTTPVPQGYSQTQQMQTGGTVTAGGQTYTQEQMAQEQANLTAGAVVDPASTVVAAPVTNINPDASGTMLAATTGQASGVAPIVTDPAQVATVATADTPTAVTAQTATTQKAQPSITAALEGGLDPQAMLDTATKGKAFIGGEGPTWNAEKGKFVQGGPETGYKEFTPEEFAEQYGLNIGDFTSGGVQAATSTGPTKSVTGQVQQKQKVDAQGNPMVDAEGNPIMETYTDVSGLDAAQIDKAQTVQGMPTRTFQAGEEISGSAVDQTKVGEAFGTGEVQAATVKDELTTLMQDFEGGNTPPWAAGAMRNATAQMQARGLGASSMAGQALIQSAMESALPIAMADASNKQQMAMMKAEQRAKFLGMEFDQNFQSKVMNAAKVSEIANMNFNAEQQVALENAKMAQTVDLANLNNKQALVMAEAAQISQLEMQGLSNMQQAQVQNAQNFLQIDMANLNNKQQTEIFKAQTLANTILSDTAAANANEQFNASSEMQVDQFNNTMKSQLNQFNSAQTNAMNQFNAGESNAIQKFNSELQNQREIFNSQMYAQIAQANAKWRQDTETINTAAANQSNFQYAKDVNGLTNKAVDQIWQKERDLMNYAYNSSESAKDRVLSIVLGDKELAGIKMQLDAADDDAFTSLVMDGLFGSGGLGGLFGGKGIIGSLFPG